uniref:NADH-ubiquinone oxidoreductase chain 5 n=1 Tax=Takobia yixiani TaxID=743459 RepID=X1W3D8_9INSE|nr:NADH dehydrogenase subunit 5 [Takobia yixiani]
MFYKPLICNYISLMLLTCSITMGTTGLTYLWSNSSNVVEWEIIFVNSVNFSYIMIFDSISCIFMSVVLLIASSVVWFSSDYMNGDPNLNRFIWLVTLFVASMMALILSPNLLSILLGWDGLGLVSYALVIYYQNVKSYNAGMLTILTNRIGDVMILVSIALLNSHGSFNLLNYSSFSGNLLMLCTIFLCIAACSKSAQIPFSAWLPAAMAAPTPVSALVHSSTLVTAGGMHMIRFSCPLMTFNVSKILLILATLTMLLAGVGANLEMDMKKIIALSTLSQLGLMMMAIGLGLTKLAYFHMVSHALFKALLFMCAGNIIHSSLDNQDLRKLGYLCLQMPVTSACLNTANLALCGFPFLVGFYSKDLIIESFYISGTSTWVVALACFATALTLTYSMRLSYYALIYQPNNRPTFNLNDSAQFSTPALLPLTILSVTGGAILSWLIFPTPAMPILPQSLKLLIIIILGVGAVMGLSMMNSPYLSKTLTSSYTLEFLGSMWFLPSVSTRTYGFPTINLGFHATYGSDQGWMELVSSKWMGYVSSASSKTIQSHQIINMKYYLITFIMWILGVTLIQML